MPREPRTWLMLSIWPCPVGWSRMQQLGRETAVEVIGQLAQLRRSVATERRPAGWDLWQP